MDESTALGRDDDEAVEEEGLGTPVAEARPPSLVYREGLEGYDGARLYAMAALVGLADLPARPGKLAGALADHLGESRAAARALEALSRGPRLVLSLFSLTERADWPLDGVEHAAKALGEDVTAAVVPLLERGLLALGREEGLVVNDFERLLAPGAERPASRRLVAHPAALAAARTVLPEGEGLPRAGPVRQVREADGLEPLLRLAVVWQRVAEAPLRQTQTGTFYKRDRERIEEDPVLAGPIADALEPLPDMPAFWLALARGVGLLQAEAGSDRVKAAAPDYWSENAIHLPQMIAARWLGLRSWHEQGGMQREGAEATLALPFVRPVVLLWLATLGADEWVTLDDLGAFLRARSADWDRPAFLPAPALPASNGAGRPRGALRAKPASKAAADDATALEALLLGPAYQLGLVRAAEEAAGTGRAVQLTPLGRYLLAVGPGPAPRPAFDHFLFVQPSFEVIAYRQGLTPALVGRFSRFAVWSAVGAALALKLTPESVYRGLEGGLTTQSMLELLSRHSPRALPSGVAEALRTWASRRERVTFYAAATLIEFAHPEQADRFLERWDGDRAPAPVRVTERLLLVEDTEALKAYNHLFRMTAARDYRHPPEACVLVGADGVSLALDTARSDLLVDAEIGRFADEQPAEPSATPKRRFAVTATSLARGAESGLNAEQLGLWFQRRTGSDAPPAVRLLLLAAGPKVPALSASRPLVLHTKTAEVLDGLSQHPETRPWLGPRLGPTSVVIPDDRLGPFRAALARLGLALDVPEAAAR